MIVYHATFECNVQSISDGGLGANGATVYVAAPWRYTSRGVAQFIADVRGPVHAADHPDCRVVVYELSVPASVLTPVVDEDGAYVLPDAQTYPAAVVGSWTLGELT